MIRKIIEINGFEKTIVAEPETMLSDVLRERLFLTGTKVGCGKGECGEIYLHAKPAGHGAQQVSVFSGLSA